MVLNGAQADKTYCGVGFVQLSKFSQHSNWSFLGSDFLIKGIISAHCYNFSETRLPAGNDCVGSVLLKHIVDFRNREGEKKSFPEVLIKVFGLYFLLPRRSSVEKGASIFLRFFPMGWGRERGCSRTPSRDLGFWEKWQ